MTIARTMFTLYPRRTVLGFSLFIGQAFLYNAITFGYAQILATFFGVKPTPATTSRSSPSATSSARSCWAASSTPSAASP